MGDDWLSQLEQLYENDKAKHPQAKDGALEITPAKRRLEASELLRKSNAHKLLRQVQKTLLKGKGALDIFDRAKDYERLITLVWQGPISAARRPDPDDPEPYSYILVGVKEGKLWVNGNKLAKPTPDALKTALLKACKKPKYEKQNS